MAPPLYIERPLHFHQFMLSMTAGGSARAFFDDLINYQIFMSKSNELSPVATIRLKGEPYQSTLPTGYQDTSSARERLAKQTQYALAVREHLEKREECLQLLGPGAFRVLMNKVSGPETLSFNESYALLTYVLGGANAEVRDFLSRMQGQLPDETWKMRAISLLTAVSTRESLIGLKPEEIAGMVAATLELDTIARVRSNDNVIGIGGMGGDRGLEVNGNFKLMNVSTLTALFLAAAGYNVHKHHSYPNTSKVGGQNLIEHLGARSDLNFADLDERCDSKIIMTSCHVWRYLHDLSHVLKGETVNHALGPLAIPQHPEDDLSMFIGVNHNIHPETMIDTLLVLQKNGVQSYGNSVAFCGIDVQEVSDVPDGLLDPEQYAKDQGLKRYVIVDEVAPPPYLTLASFLVDGCNLGTFVLHPLDFMSKKDLDQLDTDKLWLKNSADDLINAAESVIRGEQQNQTVYLSMSVALAIFNQKYASRPDAFDPENRRVNRQYMRQAYSEAREITSQQVKSELARYRDRTHTDPLPGIEAVIFDIDDTLVNPRKSSYYRYFGLAVEEAIADYFGIDPDRAKELADMYRQNHGGGEQALFTGNAHGYLGIEPRDCNFSVLYRKMSAIDCAPYYQPDDYVVWLLHYLRNAGKRIIALTDSPEDLSRKVLRIYGIDPDGDFDRYIAYREDSGPPKLMKGQDIFEEIRRELGIPASRIISVGDSLLRDVLPAAELGMHTCWVSPEDNDNNPGIRISDIYDFTHAWRVAVASGSVRIKS